MDRYELGTRLRGVTRRAFLILGVADRDPAAFDEPERLRFDRGLVRHVGFGLGPHFCLGAPLAELEASIAIPAIVKRFPNLQLAPGPLQWLPYLGTRGLRELKLVTG
ncbi:MAG: cytochrome P450 [Gammaproteobacteria bacterium]